MAWAPRPVNFSPAQRRTILHRDPVCRACKAAPSTEADHIVPLFEGGANEVANGQGLCSPCHWTKSRQETARAVARANALRPRQRRQPESHPGIV